MDDDVEMTFDEFVNKRNSGLAIWYIFQPFRQHFHLLQQLQQQEPVKQKPLRRSTRTRRPQNRLTLYIISHIRI